ncbi:recombinase family protein [Faecalicatena contorta]|uniref:recombinase family protein n=1 Tax=Faecalicatena contorta TaxID=39482 RepID=UPI003CD09936
MHTPYTKDPKSHSEWDIHENHYPVIIPREQFEQIQEIMKSHSNHPRGNGFHYVPDNMLRGKIICGGCNLPTGRGKNKKGIFIDVKQKCIRGSQTAPKISLTVLSLWRLSCIL